MFYVKATAHPSYIAMFFGLLFISICVYLANEKKNIGPLNWHEIKIYPDRHVFLLNTCKQGQKTKKEYIPCECQRNDKLFVLRSFHLQGGDATSIL